MSLRRDDRGFTLIELLIAIVILGVIIVPLAGAIISYLRNTNATVGRLSENHDVQIAAAYFAQDVDSVGLRDWADKTTPFALAKSIETGTNTVGSYAACGPSAVVRFGWDNPDDATAVQQEQVAYVVPAATPKELHRVVCVNGAQTSDTVLVHNVAATAPTVTCYKDAADVVGVACTSAAPVPQRVKLVLTVRNSATGQDLPVTLVGQRRQS